ncbi:hypothetical protein PQR39_26315 [Paraburkholderia sediminicola]|uniref:hypothetical protein n=1 Tax=Paraburkholderia sediminicola TaxID=458836 RepID=UPI0038B8E25F
MAKPVISPEEFIAEVNKRLPDHGTFKNGLHVFLVPRRATGATARGYDWEPKDLDSTTAVAAVADHVDSAYDVDPFISRAALK